MKVWKLSIMTGVTAPEMAPPPDATDRGVSDTRKGEGLSLAYIDPDPLCKGSDTERVTE